MSYYRRTSWEGGAVAAVVGVVLVVVVVAALVVLATANEAPQVYQTRALRPSHPRNARHLWIALAALLGVWSTAALLIVMTTYQSLGWGLAAWGFLAWVIAVEVIDYRARKSTPPPPRELTVSDVLLPWNREETAINENRNNHQALPAHTIS